MFTDKIWAEYADAIGARQKLDTEQQELEKLYKNDSKGVEASDAF